MKARTIGVLLILSLLGSLASCNACRERYFNTLERVGKERRELLVDRVESAKDAQVDAQEQFQDALEQFQELVGHDGGDLERMYKKLDREYERSRERTEEVHDRIRKVRNVGSSLFEQWKAELDQYENATLRRESERELGRTRERYDEVVDVMQKAALRMDPVLAQLHDQVLFLKHNLNARALGSLQQTSQELEIDVSTLIAEMQASIREADSFIQDMRGDEAP